jgi:hypothetical protein
MIVSKIMIFCRVIALLVAMPIKLVLSAGLILVFVMHADYLSIFFLINIFFEVKLLSEYISCLKNPNSELMK